MKDTNGTPFRVPMGQYLDLESVAKFCVKFFLTYEEADRNGFADIYLHKC